MHKILSFIMMGFAGAAVTGQYLSERNLTVQQSHNTEGLGIVLQTIPAQPRDVDITSPCLARDTMQMAVYCVPSAVYVTTPPSASLITYTD